MLPHELAPYRSLAAGMGARTSAAAMAAGSRPLLHEALQGDEAGIEAGLSEEERVEWAADRAYWVPLKQELERMRHA